YTRPPPRASRSSTGGCLLQRSTTSSCPRQGPRWRAPPARTAPARAPAGRAGASALKQPVDEPRDAHADRRAGETRAAEDAAPALPGLPDRVLPRDPARSERERAESRHAAARVPDALLRLLRDRRGLHPGCDVLDDQPRN